MTTNEIAGPVRYPQHEVAELKDGKPTGEMVPCGTGGALVLLGQVGRAEDGNSLFCLRCALPMLATSAEHAKATRAAASEGWTPPPPRTGPSTPGDLDGETRRQLSGLLRLERLYGQPDMDPYRAAARKDAETKHAQGFDHGLVEGPGLGTLTDAGRALAIRILDPEVPDAVAHATHAPDYMAKYAAKVRTKKPKAAKLTEAAAPMVCMCGDTVGVHTGTRPKGRGIEPDPSPHRARTVAPTGASATATGKRSR